MNARSLSDIRHLYVMLGDSHLVYHLAAELASHEEVRNWFTASEEERGNMMHALLHQMTLLGEAVPTGGSAGGTVNRIWLRIRDTLSGLNDHAMLSECIQGEQHLLTHYEEVLGEDAEETDLRALLQQQRRLIGKSLEKMNELAVQNA